MSLQGRYFPLSDNINLAEKQRIKEAGHMLKAPEGTRIPTFKVTCLGHYLKDGLSVVAVYSGVKRPPKKGEWYLSGASITAYRAPNDLSTDYHIATLVVIEKRTFEKRRTLMRL